jgi:hypothetical protein
MTSLDMKLGELIEWSSIDALKGFVIQIVGPLIRIVGDKCSTPTRLAILNSMKYVFHFVPV